MMSLNKVFLIGNLTRDPRLRTTPSGISVGEFSVAVNDSYTTAGGDRRERTVFVDIVVWKRLAENCYRFLHKGRAVLVEGRLEQDTWEDKETGQRRSRLRVVAQNVTFLYRPDEKRQKPREVSDSSSRETRDSGYNAGNVYDEVTTEETDSYGLDDASEDLPGDDNIPF